MQRPAAIYGSASGRIDVFWVSLDNSSVLQTWFEGSQWHTATVAKAEDPFGLAPSAYADELGRMDVGWTDLAGKIWYTQLNGGQWATPSELNLSKMFAGKQGLPGPPNFNPGSPLIAYNTANRRSHNTEFLVCDHPNQVVVLLASPHLYRGQNRLTHKSRINTPRQFPS